MSPKDRVKANLYKQLLQEEKAKNKRYVKASVSVFLVGIVSVSSYKGYIKEELTASPIMVIQKGQVVEKRNKVDLDAFYSRDILDKKKVEIDTDQVFGFDQQS